MIISGFPWVIGRTTKEGDIQDVSIETTSEGLNRIQIARDARNTDPRRYIVDRRTLPGGAWRRLLEAESFSEEALPDTLSEVRAIVEFETIPNTWGLEVEKTWGLPSGMESPWIEPLEMVGNELILNMDTIWVSGDAPINVPSNNTYRNGKYVTTIRNESVLFQDVTGETLGIVTTDTNLLEWEEGVAGAALFNGGSVYIEPGKPPIFEGTFVLDKDPIPVQPGLYEYGENYLISSTQIMGRRGMGAISFIKDPYPQRWIRRMFGRAYVQLVSPANVPPLIEEEPSRIGIEAYPVPTDFDIEPWVVTPYANKTGIFNAWSLDTPEVLYAPRERPYDLFLPFDNRHEDWGGFSVRHPGVFIPALDWKSNRHSAYPTQIPYELPNIPEIGEGTLFFRWKDSSDFQVIKTDWMKVNYKDGYLYFYSSISPAATGISRMIVSSGWNHTKVEWSGHQLRVNDVPALTEELTWGEVLGDDHTWGEVGNILASKYPTPNNYPVFEETYHEIPPDWETGLPEEEIATPLPDYDSRAKTWGRVTYEEYDREVLNANSSIRISSIQDNYIRRYI